LTDTELIVFFFNALQRPIVSLRLYARNWGPAEITRVLNEFRDIKPDGYHRNTCSVKCTKAIKRGREIYGEGWERHWRSFFPGADDTPATDAIRLNEFEGKDTCALEDYRVLDLLTGLKKIPVHDGTEAGLFSAAVEWCALNQADIGLSLIHKVVIALKHDLNPFEILAIEDSLVEKMLVNVESIRNRSKVVTPIDKSAGTVCSSLSNNNEERFKYDRSEERSTAKTMNGEKDSSNTYIKTEDSE
jgi:hypothetical protein